jgi:lipoprotein NlpD
MSFIRFHPALGASPAWSACLAALLLGACASSKTPAPIGEAPRPIAITPGAPAPGPGSTPATTLPPAGAPASPYIGPYADRAGQPGYYVVKRGDTLMRIGLETGQDWRDIARWNQISNPNVIEVNQVLRVAPEVVARVPSSVEPRPLPPTASGPAAAPGAAASAPAATASAPATGGTDADAEVVWAWPAAGPILAPFNEATNKGLDIGGKAGDPVYAAGDGRVVYAGNGLRGYGNLVIIKHSELFLSAYAHNQALLVKEGQVVKRGQRIAEMGSTDSDRVKLHFEIRRQGKPVDPSKWLPSK